jgi:hypothetical protein
MNMNKKAEAIREQVEKMDQACDNLTDALDLVMEAQALINEVFQFSQANLKGQVAANAEESSSSGEELLSLVVECQRLFDSLEASLGLIK